MGNAKITNIIQKRGIISNTVLNNLKKVSIFAYDDGNTTTTQLINIMNPKVTLSVAIYNVAPFIEQCVRSLYEQTLEDIEILLVDDCTPDESIDIALRALEDYPHRKSQVRVIHHEKNMGIGITKRDCILEARGEYFVLIDGDDFADIHLAEHLYNLALEHNADIAVGDFCYYVNNETIDDTLIPANIENDLAAIKHYWIEFQCCPFMQMRLIRRSLFVDNPVMWPVQSMNEDMVTCTMATYYAQSIVHLKERVYYLRYNPNSITSVHDSDKAISNLEQTILNTQIVEQFLKREGAYSQYADGLFLCNIRTKNYLLPYMAERKVRKKWRETYPETTHEILFGKRFRGIKLKYKVWYIFAYTGIIRFLPKNSRIKPYSKWK